VGATTVEAVTAGDAAVAAAGGSAAAAADLAAAFFDTDASVGFGSPWRRFRFRAGIASCDDLLYREWGGRRQLMVTAESD